MKLVFLKFDNVFEATAGLNSLGVGGDVKLVTGDGAVLVYVSEQRAKSIQHAVSDLASMRSARESALPDVLHDFVTHRASWRAALEQRIASAPEDRQPTPEDVGSFDRSYWQHQLDTFDNAIEALTKYFTHGVA